MATSRSWVDAELGKPIKKKHVLQRLEDMFGNVFDWNFIHSVAQSCNWDIHLSTERLMALSEDPSRGRSRKVSAQMSNPSGKKSEPHKPPQKKFVNVNKKFKDKKIANVGGLKELHAAKGMPRQAHPPLPFSHPNMSGLGPFKVAYQGMHNAQDLDDADVVVEEVTEFEIVGGSNFRRDGVAPSLIQYHAPGDLLCAEPITNKNVGMLKSMMPGEGKKSRPHSQQRETQSRVQEKKFVQSETQNVNAVNHGNPIIRIKSHVQNGTRILILLRGVPGSGKSHLARHLVKMSVVGHFTDYVFSADDYFTTRNGQYVYDPSRLSEAHEWVRRSIEDKMKRCESPLFVDNTNIQSWEMQPYAVLAIKYGYVLELLEPHNTWRYEEKQLTKRNVHGVPQQKIREMLRRFEPHHTGKSLLKLFNLCYHPAVKPPQPAAHKSLAARIEKKVNLQKLPKKNKKKQDVSKSQVKQLDTGSETELQIRNELKDIITLYFAKKLQDQGQQMDPDTIKSKLSCGLSVEEILKTPSEINQSAPDQCVLNSAVSTEHTATTSSVCSTSNLHDASNTFGLFGCNSNSSSESGSAQDSSDSDSEVNCVDQDDNDGGDTENCHVTLNDDDWEDTENNREALVASVESLSTKESVEILPEDLWKYVMLSKTDSATEIDNFGNNFLSALLADSTGNRVQYVNTTHSDNLENNANANHFAEVPFSSNVVQEVISHSEVTETNNTVSENATERKATPRDVTESSAALTALSEVSDISIGHSVIPGIIAALIDSVTDLTHNDDNHSGISETGAIHLGTSDIRVALGDKIESSVVQSDVLESTARVHVPELNVTDSGIPEINSIHSNKPIINDTHTAKQDTVAYTDVETSASPVDIQNISTSPNNVTEISAPSSGMSDINATHIDVTKIINTSHSGIPAIRSEHFDTVETSATPDISTVVKDKPVINVSSNMLEGNIRNEIISTVVISGGSNLHFQRYTELIPCDSVLPLEITSSVCEQFTSVTSDMTSVLTYTPEHCEVSREEIGNCTNQINENIGLHSNVEELAITAGSPCSESGGCDSRHVVSGDVLSHNTDEAKKQWLRQLEQDLLNGLISNQDLETTDNEGDQISNGSEPHKELVDVSVECDAAIDKLGIVIKLDGNEKENSNTLLTCIGLKSALEVSGEGTDVSKCLHKSVCKAEEFKEDHNEDVASDQVVKTVVTIDNATGSNCIARFNNTVPANVDCMDLVDTIVPVNTSGAEIHLLEQHSCLDSGSCVKEDGAHEVEEPSLLDAAKLEQEDIWQVWERGTSWEGNGAEPVTIEGSVDAGKPKPERHMKRERVLSGAVVRERIVDDDPPLLDEIKEWQTVVDADVSWKSENSMDLLNLDTLLTSEEPLPQREIFADDKNLDKIAPELCDKVDLLSGKDNLEDNDCHHLQEERIFTESSTNTHHTDFWISRLVESSDKGEEMLELCGVKVLASSGQYVSVILVTDLERTRNVPSVLMLDKSSMTGEDGDCGIPVASADGVAKKRSFEQLARVFCHIPRDELKELFDKCQEDVNWTAEMLLDSGYEPQDTLQDLDDSFVNNVDDGSENQASSAPEAASEELFFNKISTESPISSTQTNIETRACTSKKGGKNAFKTQSSAESLELKKHFEMNVHFDSSHYSEHVQRIKRIRHGEFVGTEEVRYSPQEPSAPFAEENDDQEGVDGVVQRPAEDDPEAATQSSDDEQTEWLPLTLDRQFVAKLHMLFGNPAILSPPDSEAVVSVPLGLARQLYCCLTDARESLAEQRSREDEALARRLQQQESEAGGQACDLQQIMDMELALSLYRADVDQSCGETRDDMATRLSRAKLAEAFPEVEQGALAEVLRAHDYSFSETCEVLQASVAGGREDRVLHVFSPEALERHERRLLRQVQLEGAKALELEEAPKALDDDCDKDQALRDANHYRAEAARHAQLRLECDLKAREAYRSKMYSVASYYSQVVRAERQPGPADSPRDADHSAQQRNLKLPELAF
ncbi:uncharacterized protein LOC134542183 isoform X2 [Bacillus rossius redtenbacheri]|uniref:uncharacterized protein LOC134542183 isoform X2 n=1 Tax=Bacillus rossius redtenbacheri TaxID=93214 RepID=UPI002FDC8330